MIKNFPKEEFFSFLKIFIFCFAVVFLALNFGTIKRIFNYKIVYGNAQVVQSPTTTPAQAAQTVQKKVAPVVKPDSIEISKIKITAPLVFIETAEKSVFSEALDRGVVHYPDSALPGEKGQIVLLGHSAPLGWPKIKHDWVFSEINELVSGDEVIIYYKNKKHIYHVQKKIILEKGEDLPGDIADGLILLTCWPPGSDQRRMAVIAY